MARTKDEINSQVLEAIQAQPALSGLTSTSVTSVWGQFKDAIVSILQISEQLGDIQEARLNTIADEAVPGTPYWLQRQVFKFQYGDQIVLNTSDLTYSYPTVDASKQIITRCSVVQLDESREVLLKVAKGADASLAPLTADELSSLRAYVNEIKFAGTHILPVTMDADRVVTGIDVYYSGELVEDDVKEAVINAIKLFYQNIPFDGTLRLTKLVDTVQAVAGVTDVVLKNVVARPATVALNDATLQPITRSYNTQAGYITPEDAQGYTLEDTIKLFVE